MLLPSLEKAKCRTKKEVLVKTNDYIIKENLKELGLNKKYFIKTYGCQMNEHDSENIKAILEEMSFEYTDEMEDADLILLNTCAIRENAHNKVFGYLGRIKHLKETKPNIIVGLCGCMAQEEVVINEILEKYNWLDIVFGTHNIHALPDILLKALKNKKINVEVLSIEGDVVENIPVKRDSKYKAWVNIMYGCDKFCTYCIVPYTRGKQRSRLPEFIIEEVNKLVTDGYKEVTLLGQNVNAYGKDLDINYGMANLLEDVANTGIERIRFVTSHPWDFTDEMIDVISKCDNVMPYVHLPIQSGSDRILKLMGRRYTKEEYITLYNKIRNKVKDVSITTDIIVGFPGETESDFEETLDIVNTCKFDGAFTFIFSPRVGTPASKLPDNTPKEEKESRLHKLNELVNKYSNLSNQAILNKVVKCLVTSVSEKDNSKYMGYTENMKLVNIESDTDIIGEIVNVKITEAKSFSLNGVHVK